MFVRRLLAGVSYLHGEGVVYRDLRVSNVMVGGDKNVSIIDFGHAFDFRDAEGKGKDVSAWLRYCGRGGML